MMKTIITKSFEETQGVGFDLAKQLKGGEILALYGDLGSGKTTFVQGLAKGLGISRQIISPTFIIMRTYEIRITNCELRIKNFYHVDLYRVQGERDIEGLGLLEIFDDQENVIAIEWPDKIDKILPEQKITIHFEYLNEDQRRIMIKNHYIS